MDLQVVFNRIVRLARLDTTVFDEVRDDPRELLPAALIMTLGALLAGIGVWLWLIFAAPGSTQVEHGKVIIKILILGTLFAVILWAVWVAVVYVVLVQFYREQCDIQGLLRTMGYASFPFALSFLMLIPGLSFAIGVVAVVLWFVMSIYAVQAATTAGSDRVIFATGIGFVVFAIVMGLIARESGLTTGVFINAESYRAIGEGCFWSISDQCVFG
jgi:hypothetical protein